VNCNMCTMGKRHASNYKGPIEETREDGNLGRKRVRTLRSGGEQAERYIRHLLRRGWIRKKI